MDYKEYIKKLNSGDIKAVCALTGEEEYIKRTIVKRIEDKYLSEDALATDEECYSDENADYNAIAVSFSSMPMLSQRKVIYIGIKPANQLMKDARFADLIKKAGNEIICILNIRGQPDKRCAVSKALGLCADVVNMDEIDKRDIIKWAVQNAPKIGSTISGQNAEYLAAVSDWELYSVKNNLEKVAAFADGQEITKETIELLTEHTPEHGVFALVDAAASRNAQAVLRQYALIMDDGGEPLQLLALLVRQYQLILRYSSCESHKMTQSEMLSRLGVKPFVINKLRAQASKYDEQSCKKALSMCLGLDYSIKSGAIEATVGFELLLIKLCTEC